MEGLAKGYGYAILQVARRVDETHGTLEVRELRDPLMNFKFLTFPKPGKWEVGLFLFERTRVIDGKDATVMLERGLRKNFCAERQRKNWPYYGRYSWQIEDLADVAIASADGKYVADVLSVNYWSADEGRAIAKFVKTVNVPDDIFAKPRNPFVWGLGNYFYSYAPYDECEFRNRMWVRGMMLLGIIPFGIIPWFVIELLKRVACLVAGLGLFLLLVLKGSPKVIGSAFSRDSKLDLGYAFGECGLKFLGWWGKEEWHSFFVPGVFLVLAALGLSVVGILFIVGEFLLSYWIVSLICLGIISLVLSTYFFVPRLFEAIGAYVSRKAAESAVLGEPVPVTKTESIFSKIGRAYRDYKHERTLHAGAAKAAFAEEFASEIICGAEPKEITLKAMPAEMVSIWTQTGREAWFRSFKRQVCRPF